MPFRCRFLACCLPLLFAALPAWALPQETYIWQRQWSPALAEAAAATAPLLQGWRVLAGEVDGRGQWQPARPDLAALRATGLPLRGVIRISGRKTPDLDQVARRANDILAEWSQAGVALRGLEIDHDAPTAQLPPYATFLHGLRGRLPAGTSLAITALPTWLNDAAALRALLAEADESVLQVHAVQRPGQGLFNGAQAMTWAEAWAKHTNKPWRVALPAYGSRVSFDEAGRLLGIDSERSSMIKAAEARELAAVPQSVVALRDELRAAALPGLAGFLWFRLPLASDQRAWSPATFQAALRGDALRAGLGLRLQPGPAGLPRDLYIVNDGNADAPLPAVLVLAKPCSAIDAVNGYAAEVAGGLVRLRRMDGGLLRAGKARRIGWLRCEIEAKDWRLVTEE